MHPEVRSVANVIEQRIREGVKGKRHAFKAIAPWKGRNREEMIFLLDEWPGTTEGGFTHPQLIEAALEVLRKEGLFEIERFAGRAYRVSAGDHNEVFWVLANPDAYYNI